MNPIIAELLVAAHQDDIARSARAERLARASRRGARGRRRHVFGAARRHDVES